MIAIAILITICGILSLPLLINLFTRKQKQEQQPYQGVAYDMGNCYPISKHCITDQKIIDIRVTDDDVYIIYEPKLISYEP